ncbi:MULTISPECIES: TetR/AcrR family transcriptional regulator [Providencia]|uniref:TetR/AcrR family transcriptional regulator n=1 Tax=Providencia TaxID=586 RepID=UPI0023AA682F|nr:TetR/AcrR family transcriptional regulator [Providencia rettgeri]ELR5153008.1 TetR/AcrR family transcriptional regulator [Providencia rettgeri]
MATRIPTGHRVMRKSPKQQRSQVTVEIIVEAGARVLAHKGWANFTTNEVARTAGVSIGSLYQYFPNNLAIAEAIRKRHLDEILRVLPDIKEQEEPVSLEQHIGQLIDGLIALHSTNQNLHRILIHEVPLAPREFYDTFEREYHRRYEVIIRAAAPSNDTKTDYLVAARILADALEGIVHSASRRNELMSPIIKKEMMKMIMSYLSLQESH